MSKLVEFNDIKQQIFNKILEYDTIIIHRHFRPDGDCIGSSFGLRDILRESFPPKKIYSIGKDKAKYLEFLGSEDQITAQDYENALVIVVDTSTHDRISGDNYRLGQEVIKIDHHPETDPFGTINYVVDTMPSTTTLIIDLFNTYKDQLKMSVDGARALYVGTITDTGRFRYSNVNGETLRLAADILDYGFDTQELFSNLYIKDTHILKLQGYILNHFKTSENGVSYIYISKKTQKKFGVLREEASSLVNVLDSIRGSFIWILFIQGKDVTRARIRSRHVSIIDVARQFEGGGHQQACGALVRSRRELKKLVAVADEVARKYKKEIEDKKNEDISNQ